MVRKHIRCRLFLTLFPLWLIGCTEIHVEIQNTIDQTPAVNPLPLTVGTYYSQRFSQYEEEVPFGAGRHVSTPGDPKQSTVDGAKIVFAVGGAAHGAFANVLPGVFEKVVSLKNPPPVRSSELSVDVILVPSINTIEIQGPPLQSKGTKRAAITFLISLYLPNGEKLASWTITGNGVSECQDFRCIAGEELEFALRAAIANFVVSVYSRSEIKKLRKFKLHIKEKKELI